jgi:hypothetical protein
MRMYFKGNETVLLMLDFYNIPSHAHYILAIVPRFFGDQ